MLNPISVSASSVVNTMTLERKLQYNTRSCKFPNRLRNNCLHWLLRLVVSNSVEKTSVHYFSNSGWPQCFFFYFCILPKYFYLILTVNDDISSGCEPSMGSNKEQCLPRWDYLFSFLCLIFFETDTYLWYLGYQYLYWVFLQW